MNHALPRVRMVVADAAPGCPQCGGRLGFGSDRNGRTVEACECGFEGYVTRRSGEVTEAAAAGPRPTPAQLSRGWDGLLHSVGLRGGLVTQPQGKKKGRARARPVLPNKPPAR